MKKLYKEPKLMVVVITNNLLAGSNGFADGEALEGDAKKSNFYLDDVEEKAWGSVWK